MISAQKNAFILRFYPMYTECEYTTLASFIETCEASLERISAYPGIAGITNFEEEYYAQVLEKFSKILTEAKELLTFVQGKKSLEWTEDKQLKVKVGFLWLLVSDLKKYVSAPDSSDDYVIYHPYVYELVTDIVLALKNVPPKNFRKFLGESLTSELTNQYSNYYKKAEFYYKTKLEKIITTLFPSVLNPFLIKYPSLPPCQIELEKQALLQKIIAEQSLHIVAQKDAFLNGLPAVALDFTSQGSFEADSDYLALKLKEIEASIALCKEEIVAVTDKREAMLQKPIGSFCEGIDFNADLIPESFLAASFLTVPFPDFLLTDGLKESWTHFEQDISKRMISLYEDKEKFNQTVKKQMHETEVAHIRASIKGFQASLGESYIDSETYTDLSQLSIDALISHYQSAAEANHAVLSSLKDLQTSILEKEHYIGLKLLAWESEGNLPNVGYADCLLELADIAFLLQEKIQQLATIDAYYEKALSEAHFEKEQAETIASFSVEGFEELIKQTEAKIARIEAQWLYNTQSMQALEDEIHTLKAGVILLGSQITTYDPKNQSDLIAINQEILSGIKTKILEKESEHKKKIEAVVAEETALNQEVNSAVRQIKYYKSLMVIAIKKDTINVRIESFIQADKKQALSDYFKSNFGTLHEVQNQYQELVHLYQEHVSLYPEYEHAPVQELLNLLQKKINGSVTDYFQEEITRFIKPNTLLLSEISLLINKESSVQEAFFSLLFTLDKALAEVRENNRKINKLHEKMRCLIADGFSIPESLLGEHETEKALLDAIDKVYQRLIAFLSEKPKFIFSERNLDIKNNLILLSESFAAYDLILLECQQSFQKLQHIDAKCIAQWENEILKHVQRQKNFLLFASESFQKTMVKIQERSQLVKMHRRSLDHYIELRNSDPALMLTSFLTSTSSFEEDQFIADVKLMLNQFNDSGESRPILDFLKKQAFSSEALSLVIHRLIVAIDSHANNINTLPLLSSRKKYIILSNFPQFKSLDQRISEMKSYAETLCQESPSDGEKFLAFATLLERKMNDFFIKIQRLSHEEVYDFIHTFKAYLHSEDELIKPDRNHFTFFKLKRAEKVDAVTDALDVSLSHI